MTTLGQTLRTAWDEAYAAAMASPNKHDPVWLREEKASLLADEAAAHAIKVHLLNIRVKAWAEAEKT